MRLREGSTSVAAEIYLVDRRKQADRRAEWRGGRRDSDWTGRPPGALRRFEKQPWLRSVIRRVLSL